VRSSRSRFHPGADDDYSEAFTWYFARSPTVALDFEREVERGVRLIVQSPLRWPKFDAKRRRVILRKFPYSVIYEIIAGETAMPDVDPITGLSAQRNHNFTLPTSRAST